MKSRIILLGIAAALLQSSVATADLLPPRPRPQPPRPQPKRPIRPVQPSVSGNRDAVALARRDPAVMQALNQLRHSQGGQSDETAVQITLGEQCGFAGCDHTTLVAFSYKTGGANPATQTALALVRCGPVDGTACQVALAEVHPVQPQGAPE